MSDEAIDFRSSKPRLGYFEQERAARPPRGRYEMLGRSVGLNSLPLVSHLHVRSYRASLLRSSYPCPSPRHTRVLCPLLVSATTRTRRADMVQFYILQRALEKAINRPDYTASLPPLSEKTWAKILTCTHSARAENERLKEQVEALEEDYNRVEGMLEGLMRQQVGETSELEATVRHTRLASVEVS